MATEYQESPERSAGRSTGAAIRDLVEFGPGFVSAVEQKYNPLKAGLRAAREIGSGVNKFAGGVGAGFRGDPVGRPYVEGKITGLPPAPAPVPPAAVPTAARAATPPKYIVKEGGWARPTQPSSSPRMRQAPLPVQEVVEQPEAADRSTFGGIAQDIRNRRKFAADRAAALEARKQNAVEQQQNTAAEQERQRLAIEEADKKSQADYRAAQSKLFAAQGTAQEQAATVTDLKIRALRGLYDPDPDRAAKSRIVYNLLAGTPRDSNAPMSEERFNQELALRRTSAGFDDNAPTAEGFADGGAVSALPATNRGVAPAADRSLLLAQYGQYLAAAAKVGVPPVPFQKYMGLLASTRAAAQGTPAGFAQGGGVEGAIPVAGKVLYGPGTGTSDSIPAVIDGKKPAALSDGEFVIPAVVVKAKGTEFFEKLIAPYLEKASA